MEELWTGLEIGLQRTSDDELQNVLCTGVEKRRMSPTRRVRPCVDPLKLKHVLQQLKDMGIRIGIVSQDKEWFIRKAVADMGLEEFFVGDLLFGTDSGFGHKPDPRSVYEFCKRTGIKDTSRVLIVGDASSDFSLACNSGARVVGVRSPAGKLAWEAHVDVETGQPVVVLRDVLQVVDYIVASSSPRSDRDSDSS
jgi:phosphoglycolate phosphatase-like HAD superfamily hydrolase